jgi:hypothetical protein
VRSDREIGRVTSGVLAVTVLSVLIAFYVGDKLEGHVHDPWKWLFQLAAAAVFGGVSSFVLFVVRPWKRRPD